MSFTLRDTKCDESGPRLTVYRNGVGIGSKYNDAGCDKSVTGTVWVSTGGAWTVTCRSSKTGASKHYAIS